MEVESSKQESLFEKISELSTTSLLLIRLSVIDVITKIVASTVANLSILFTSILFLLLLNTGIALYIGEYLGKLSYGFFIIAIFYLLITIFLMISLLSNSLSLSPRIK